MGPLLSDEQLAAYWKRISYAGDGRVTLDTLRAIHRAHLLEIPYENLDIHFGRHLSLEPEEAYAKLVLRGRGGWCYEMNGVLGRVLSTLGFDVRYVSGAVSRAADGSAREGTHLVLLVRLDDWWIADVGFGDGFLEPLPLREGRYWQNFLHFGVERDGSRWRVMLHEFASAREFDFTEEEKPKEYFEAPCDWLQTSPESGFVRTTVCQRFLPNGLVTLRGAVLTRVTARGAVRSLVESADEYVAVLRDVFGLDLPEGTALWPTVWERHLAYVAGRVSEAL